MGVYSTIKETIKDAVTVAQQSDNVDLYRKILDAYGAAMDLMEENIDLKQQIAEMKNELQKEKDVVKIGNAYYVKDDDGVQKGPYCMRCYDKDRKLVNYRIGYNESHKEGRCPVCAFCTCAIDEESKNLY